MLLKDTWAMSEEVSELEGLMEVERMSKNGHSVSSGANKLDQEKVSDRMHNARAIYFGDGDRGRHRVHFSDDRRSRKRTYTGERFEVHGVKRVITHVDTEIAH